MGIPKSNRFNMYGKVVQYGIKIVLINGECGGPLMDFIAFIVFIEFGCL